MARQATAPVQRRTTVNRSALHARLGLLLAAAALVAAVALAQRPAAAQPPAAQPLGELVYALTSDGRLVSFNSGAPGTLLSEVTVAGQPSGETFRGLDFRPATGQLYALSSASRLYTIAPGTGAATVVGTAAISPTVAGAIAGVDFNPVPDRLRIVSGAQNLRVNPNDGVAVVDGALAFATGDANAGQTPNVVAAGYTNNISGTTSTSLFVIDAGRDVLALQNPPNAGTLNTVGALGKDVGDRASFDISPGGAAYVSYATGGSGPSLFGTLNLTTGAITEVGPIGANVTVVGIAVPTRAPAGGDLLWAVEGDGTLVNFRSSAPGTILARIPVSGLPDGESLRGIDVRPNSGQIFALGASSRLFVVDGLSGAATLVGTAPISPTVAGSTAGFDFNPVPDRVRIVSGVQNLRVNPNDASAIRDGDLAFAAGDANAGQTPNVVAAGYTNSVRGATSTSLFVIDADRDVLALQNPPNAGTLTTIGALGQDVDEQTSMDITPAGTIYVAYSTDGGLTSTLGTLDQATGAVTPIGPIGTAGAVRGLAAPASFTLYHPLVRR
jgi:hypothetical protein